MFWETVKSLIKFHIPTSLPSLHPPRSSFPCISKLGQSGITSPPQIHADYSYSDGQSPSWTLGPVNVRLPPADWEMPWLLFPDQDICIRHPQKQHFLILIHKLLDYSSLFRPRQSPRHSPYSLIKSMMTSQLSSLSFLKSFAVIQMYDSSCSVTVISVRSWSWSFMQSSNSSC